MNIRQATRDSYTKMLTQLVLHNSRKGIALADIAEKYHVDIKLPTWLVKKGYLVEIDKEGIFKSTFSSDATEIDIIIEEFIAYRNKLNDRAILDKKDLDFYRKNKEFLVDIRNKGTLTSESEERIIKKTREALIKEVASYAETAVRLGKKDIAGFITTLLNIE